MTWHDNPTLDELLGDPMTQELMTADRVDPRALAAMLACVARVIGGRSDAWVMQEAAPCWVPESHIQSHRLGAR
jgi:hypothetical protein